MKKLIAFLLIVILLAVSITAQAESVTIKVNGKNFTVSTDSVSHSSAGSMWGGISCKNIAVGTGGHICCAAYAERMFAQIWGKSLNGATSSIPNMLSNLSKEDRTVTVEHCREYFLQAQPGAAVRVQYSDSTNRVDVAKGKYGHDLIFLSASQSGGVFYSGNHGGTGTVQIWTPTWEEFVYRFIGWRKAQSGLEPYYYISYIKWPGATPYSTYTVVEDNLDQYHTAVGIIPNPKASGFGFSTEQNGIPSSYPTYASPDTSSTVISSKPVYSYFHVVAKIKDKNGNNWYRLKEGSTVSYIQAEKLNSSYEFKGKSDVQTGYYKANIRTQWGKAPFDAKDEGTWIEQYETVEVVSAVENKYKKIWYQLAPADSGKWVYSGHFDFVKSVPTITISGQAAPSGKREKGAGFELKGTITSNENITSVVGTVYDQNTGKKPSFSTKVNPATINPNAKSVDIATYKISGSSLTINTSLKFGELPVGEYRYELVATTSSGYSKTVINSSFSVYDKNASNQYLDLNGQIDGIDSGNIGGYGTADVYINGSLVANDVDDYYQAWPTGTKYEIKDIKAATGRAYNGSNGSLSGTIGTTTTKVILSFSTIRVTGVALDQSKLTLIPDQTAELTATISPANAFDQAVAWTSDDTSVATVTVSGSNSGKATVKAIKKGTVKITCTTSDGSFTASCTVTVKVPVTGITLNSTELALEKGDSATLSATVAPSNASNKNVKWSSSDTNVVTVSDGTVKAVGVGNATITCTSADSSEIKATCKVTVEEEFIPFFVFPSSLNEIGEEAFAGIGARRVVVADGVKTIGKKAFAGCLKLEQITIPASTTTIAKDAFANVPDGFTIHSTLNSYAQTFASENGIRFVADDAYTITFNANGGVSSETTRMIKKGAAIETLPTASKSDNTFDGWYTSASGGTKVTESTVFSSDTIVYAHWKSQTCTITFDANGGSCKTDTKVINKGEAIGTLPTPTRKYYGFKGWYTKQSGGSAITTSTTFSQDQKVYATWELNGFGNWSEWSTTSVTGNDNREVQTEERSVQTGTKTIYKYKRFLYYRSDKGYYQASYASNWATSNGYSGSWQELTSETKLPVDHTTDGQNVYAGEVRNGNKWWYSESVTTEPIYSNVTYYRYRDRIQ